MINKKPSKLTTLSEQRSSLEYDILSRESLRWFQNEIRTLRDPKSLMRGIIKERNRFTRKPLIGFLYLLYYEPKYANKLPYYDIFPLVLVLERYNDGFLGLNLHYLPPMFRAAFLRRLLKYAIYDKNDDIQRIKITYDILSSSRTHRLFKPCIKRYLNSGMATPPLKIEPHEWETAVFLPTQKFQKAKVNKVWKESIQISKE